MIRDLLSRMESRIEQAVPGSYANAFQIMVALEKESDFMTLKKKAADRGFFLHLPAEQNTVSLALQPNLFPTEVGSQAEFCALGLRPPMAIYRKRIPLFSTKRKKGQSSDGRAYFYVDKIVPEANDLFALSDDEFFDEVEKEYCRELKECIKGLLALNQLLENNTPEQNNAIWQALCVLFCNPDTFVETHDPSQTVKMSHSERIRGNKFLSDYYFQDRVFAGWDNFVKKYPEIGK